MPVTVSTRCLQGACGEGDFAATYLEKFHLGYVHGADKNVYLINPRRDFWQTGPQGPGFYRQVGGSDEKLEPGRTN
jgi:ubiquinone/menaquinone biosynthesis C-methylase UbiE